MSSQIMRKGRLFSIGMNESNPKALMSPEVDACGFDASRFRKCERINDWPGDISFWYSHGEYAEDYLASLANWTLVSDRVKSILEDYSTVDAQFLPVKVFLKASKVEVGRYWALNVLRYVEALDWDKTIWSKPNPSEQEHPALSVLREALIWEQVKKVDIFRLWIRGMDNAAIYISLRLKRSLERAKVTGFYFMPVWAY